MKRSSEGLDVRVEADVGLSHHQHHQQHQHQHGEFKFIDRLQFFVVFLLSSASLVLRQRRREKRDGAR